jgi:prolyl oligopeptidase
MKIPRPFPFADYGLIVWCIPVLTVKPRSLVYPAPQRRTMDDYHGTKVADPYRWLGRQLDATKRPLTQTGHVHSTNPQRAAIKERLTQL